MTPTLDPLPEFSAASHAILGLRRRAAVGSLLILSLGCNLTALVVPFMNLRVGLAQHSYSLFYSARMLWSSGLQVLAILVVAFSIVFPFVKLGVLAWLCAAERLDGPKLRLLALVERLGKWSMLDAFLVCLILALASGQLLVGAQPLVGLSVFAAAIMLSMAGGEVLSAGLPHVPSPRPASAQAFAHSGWWLLLDGLALAGAVSMPFLQIRDWFVTDKSYSIVTVVPTLAFAGSVLPAVLIGLFLIVVPTAAWIANCVWWRRLRARRSAPLSYRLARMGRRWSMLDVFGLALAIFAVEGGSLMKTEVRWGALFLAALVAIQLAFQAALGRALEGGSP